MLSLSANSPLLRRFPVVHVTRREDKNPFNPNGLPYAQFPDQTTRVIDSVRLEARGKALALIIRDHYRDFVGTVEWLLDDQGNGRVSMDYAYHGETFSVSEAGLRFLFDLSCDEIRWRRKTEWDVYPEDHIGRPQGRAQAHAQRQRTPAVFPPYLARPHWPWHLDENEFGTRDFRATKYNIYETSLVASGGSGCRILADGNANARACLGEDGVQLYTLLASPPQQLTRSNHLTASFHIQLLAGRDGLGRR